MSPTPFNRPTTAIHSGFIHLVLLVLLLLPSAALADTEDIVGTWRKPDQSLVEFKPDGSVTAGGVAVGRWERLRDSSKYVLRFNGASPRIFYYATTGSYKRQLSLELPSTGARTNLDRVDDGPTVNPDAPNARAALEMEYKAALTGIEHTQLALERTSAEAAEARRDHETARALGRISSHLIKAKEKEAQVRSLESSLIGQRARIRELESKLGIKSK